MPPFIHSFIHSTHLPCALHRTAAQSTVLSALMNVLPGQLLSPTETPDRKTLLPQPARPTLGSCRLLLKEASPHSQGRARRPPSGLPWALHSPTLSLTTLYPNCPCAHPSPAQDFPLMVGTCVCACSLLSHRAWHGEGTPAIFAK